jgi:hypothetical protein
MKQIYHTNHTLEEKGGNLWRITIPMLTRIYVSHRATREKMRTIVKCVATMLRTAEM